MKLILSSTQSIAVLRTSCPALPGGLASAIGTSSFKSMAGLDRHPSLTALGAAGIKGQLASAIGAFAIQRRSFDALMVGASSRHGLFAAQIGQNTSSQDAISRVVLGASVVEPDSLFSSLSRYAEVQASLGSFIAADHTTLLRGLTRVSSRRYDSYLNGLPATPNATRSAVARFGGDVQSGMIIAESLTAADLSSTDRNELAEQYTVEVLEPWQTGPTRAREDLFAQLAMLAPDLPDWLKAAWDDIERDGPKAASKIANCTVECIDRTLRVVADVDSVMAWVASVGAKPGWIDKGRPTRRAKIMFAMRDRSKRDASLADAQVEALITLVQNVVSDLQSVKHNEAPGVAAMRAMVQAAEAALSQLLMA